uniref:GIY-YIG nuclease family protein n=1 Tax=Escherichia coli TaxID=562 RepID=UPI0013000D34
IMDSIGNVIAYKIGITNKTAEERCRTINKSTTLHCEVIYSYSAIGSKVQKIESIIKKSIERAYLNKELMNDGSTETFNPTHIFHVIHLIFEHAK